MPVTGDTVFVISVNADTGVVTLDQQRAVIHSPDTGPDQAVTLADDVITLTATATDGDTDTASKTEDVGDRFTFKDDAPTAGTNTAVQLDDETAQSTLGTPPNPGGTGDATGTSATATGTLAHTFGADGAGTVLLTSATLPASGGFSQSLSVDNKTLTISQLQNGASVDVVKIEVTNAATGAYTVTHLAQVFHPTPGTTEEDVTFTVNYQVTDKDGDTASSSINVLVDDDTPTIAAGTNPTALTVDETTLATNDSGSFASLFNVSYGADGQASTGALAYALGIGVVGADSGLDDTLTGNSVFLFLSRRDDDHRQGGDQPGGCGDGRHRLRHQRQRRHRRGDARPAARRHPLAGHRAGPGGDPGRQRHHPDGDREGRRSRHGQSHGERGRPLHLQGRRAVDHGRRRDRNLRRGRRRASGITPPAPTGSSR